MWGFIIGGIVIVVLIIWIISMRNGLMQSQVKIDEAESGIDVALTKRFDTLQKMLDVTKAYAKHEKETILETIQMRKGMSMGELNQANAAMDQAMRSINVVAEAYPELRSNENFRQLQVTIADVEEHLQAARRLYNSNVSLYNQKLVSFPSSVIASSMHLTKREFFEAETAKRADVKMDFN